MWRNRNRKKKYNKANTNHLFEHCDYEYSLDNIEQSDIPVDKYLIEKMIEIIKEDCVSTDENLFYKARVFNYSNGNIAGLPNLEGFESASDFSRQSNIPQQAVIQTCAVYKKYLKERLKKCLQ